MIKQVEQKSHVKFVSYTGRYPNLCRGVLTLNIDGEDVMFGHDYFGDWQNDGHYDDFWVTGGSVYFTDDWATDVVENDDWIIYKDSLPEEYQKYVEEIAEVFNANVSHGCCGGCI